MQEENQDKKPLPGNDLTEFEPDQNTTPDMPAEEEEQDLDDLVHTTLPEEINAEDEADVDDLVHKLPDNPDSSSETEKDPDDMVHGN